MKKILLIALFLIPFFGFSQTKKSIEGFLGIKFGSSIDEVKAAMQAKGGKLTNSDRNSLAFSNVNLGERAASQFFVFFEDNKAYEAVFYFNPGNDPSAAPYYNSLVKDLSDVYGKGEPYRYFKTPFADGDGNETTAINGGYATIFTSWKDPNKKTTIEASIKSKDDDLYIRLMYIDDPMLDQVQKKEKAKSNADL